MFDIRSDSLEGVELIEITEEQCLAGIDLFNFCTDVVTHSATRQISTPFDADGTSRWYARVAPVYHDDGMHFELDSVGVSAHSGDFSIYKSEDASLLVALKRDKGFWVCEITHSTNAHFIDQKFDHYQHITFKSNEHNIKRLKS